MATYNLTSSIPNIYDLRDGDILNCPYSGTYKYHYKYNISTNTWSSVSTLPYNFYQGSAIVLDNEIHILGSGYYSIGYIYCRCNNFVFGRYFCV